MALAKGIEMFTYFIKTKIDIDLQWASEAESIKGMNELLYQEAARNKRAINYQRTAADPRACKHRNHQL